MAKKKLQPIAFMSYVRFDDEHDNGRLTQFCQRLSAEVRVQTGEEFPIFQDRNDIKWGQNWKERVEESLDQVTFLIPIITPSFFKSPPCRDELEKFLEREKNLKRKDLVLSVYYVDCPLLNDEEKCATDGLAKAVAAHQYADWRDLRFELFTSPQVGKTLAGLAVQVRDALERVASASVVPPKRTGAGKARGRTRAASRTPRRAPDTEATEAQPEAVQPTSAGAEPPTRGPSAKVLPPTLVVDPLHRGDHATISQAISAANPGDRILVRPGLYQEGLVMDKPLELIGDGGPGEVVIQASGADAILFSATMGKIANLTLRQAGGGEESWYGVDIAQGRLEMEDCDISSQSLSCVGIHGGADPRLRRNRIHGCKGGSGVFVYENGQGVLEDNEIFGNAYSGVTIKEGGNPTLRRNRIHDSKGGGVFVYENGQGVLEDNEIFGNVYSGVDIGGGANPVLRRNRIHDNKGGSGVAVRGNGQGVIEDNEIFGNVYAGVAIMDGGNPTLRRNRIHDGKQSGVFVYGNGQGMLEDNEIFGNAFAGVAIKGGGNPTLRRNRISRNGRHAVSVKDGGAGTFEGNDLRDNARGPWSISEDSEPNVKRARNLEA